MPREALSLSLVLSPGSSRPTLMLILLPLADLRRSIFISTGCIECTSCNARSRQPTCLARSPLHMGESHAAVDDSPGRTFGGRPIRQRTDRAHRDLRAGFNPARVRLTTGWNKPTARPTRDGASGSRDHHRPGQAWGMGRAEGVAAAISACSKRIAHSRPSPSIPFARAPCSHRIAVSASFGCSSEPRRADDPDFRHRDTHARFDSIRFALI